MLLLTRMRVNSRPYTPRLASGGPFPQLRFQRSTQVSITEHMGVIVQPRARWSEPGTLDVSACGGYSDEDEVSLDFSSASDPCV